MPLPRLYSSNIQQIESVLVAHTIPLLGTYFGCKPLYRFNGLNVFGQVWIPDRGCIFQMGAHLCDIQGSECTGIRIFVKLTVQ